MAEYTKTSVGPPVTGFYNVGDRVTDSGGNIWKCVMAGFPGVFLGEAYAPGLVGTAGTLVTAQEFFTQSGDHRTVLTLAEVAQAVVNGTEYQSSLIYTFPEGRILVQGVTFSLQQKTTSTIASTIHASSTGAFGLGSAAASNTTLSSTMVNMAPSTAFTSSATINVAGTAFTGALAASAQIDGTATPVPVYANTAFATTADVAADGTQTFTGTITISWKHLGDY